MLKEICPEMHAYETHELYDRHDKVSPSLNSYQNTNNSVKHASYVNDKYPKYPNSVCLLEMFLFK